MYKYKINTARSKACRRICLLRKGDKPEGLSWYWCFAVVCMLMVVNNAGVVAQEEATGEAGISGYMRVDTDALGTQFWFGATHTLAGLDIGSDIYVTGAAGEFDIGPSFAVGPASLLPMAGIVFDYETTNVTTLVVPQLFTILDSGESGLYFESWIQLFLNSPFDEKGEDSLYTRNFLLYSLSDTISIGPQVEITVGLGDKSELINLPIGGRINLGYGKNNTLGIFLGYETQKTDDVDGITGRMTFVRTW
ncbi:MAG: hypothetical protein ACE5PV_17085 [Candidatus Poribacteria bacterium]